MNGNSNLFEVILKVQQANPPHPLERKWVTGMFVRIVKNNPFGVFCFILLPAVLKRLYRSQVPVALASSGKLFWEPLLSPVPSRVTFCKAGRNVRGWG